MRLTRTLSLALLTALLLGRIAGPGVAQSPPVYNPANGHWYQDFRTGGLTWQQARAAAAGLTYAGYPGHLVTITSAEENQFLLTQLPNTALGAMPALGQLSSTQPAGPGGEVLSLTSSNPAAAVVPATVTVPAGASSATFVITTLPVAAPTPVQITAACSFGPQSATLQV